MKSYGTGVLKRIAYKAGGVVSIRLSILCGNDGDKGRYLSATLNANAQKCQGLSAVEFELKKAQSIKPDETLLVNFEALNIYGYQSTCKEYINYSGLMTSINLRENREAKK